MRVLRMSSIAVVVGAALFALACGNSTTTPTTVSSLAITGVVPSVGTTSQFKAMATMSDGTTQDVTTLASWGTSNAGIASVSATGVVSGIADGTVVVSATYQSVTGTDQISLTD